MREELGDSVQGTLEDKSVLLRGLVRSQAEGDRAIEIASGYGTPVNLMTIAIPPAPQQILLKVRFASVDRTASLSLGANIFGTGAAGNTIGGTTQWAVFRPNSHAAPSASPAPPAPVNLSNALKVFLFKPSLNLGATLVALAATGFVEILAEPNVLAADGKAASFLAGGEFPFPVVQSSSAGVSNVTIQFREFGIRLNFTPTITARGTIKLEVNPEVSSLDYANGLTYQGFNIPGLDVRRVKTEIELENNQSFAIAGLIDNQVTKNLSKVPGLGDIPLLGKLFQSQSLTKNNSELLVVVTPELVQPISAGSQQLTIPMPLEFLKDGGTTLPANSPDTKAVPKLQQMPFEPSVKKPAAQPANETPGTSVGNSIKDALRNGMTP